MMVTPRQLRVWKRRLHARLPFVGPWQRRRTVRALAAHREDALVVQLLLEVAESPDPAIASESRKALAHLTTQPAIDALCSWWAQSRAPWLGEMMASQNYVASEPRDVRVLSALRSGKVLAINQTDWVPVLAQCLEDSDPVIRHGAERSLRRLEPGPVLDALCEVAIRHPGGGAARLCVEHGKRPRDHERLCLFLFVTRQLDAYFREDSEFQNLRLEYDRAEAEVKAKVLEVLRSGDRRCLRFFEYRSKPLGECSVEEIQQALESWRDHREWARLFQASLELPMKFSVPLFLTLRRSGWKPDQPGLMGVHAEVLRALNKERLTAPDVERTGERNVIERWLAEGANSDLANRPVDELVVLLKNSPPPEAVKIMGALASREGPWTTVSRVVRNSPHWLIRLAGEIVGVERSPEETDWDFSDPNHWVREFGSVSGLMNTWPAKATPTDLQTLSEAPSEAWLGRLGTIRQLLRTILSYRITAGAFEPLVVPPREFAAEFVPAETRPSGPDKV